MKRYYKTQKYKAYNYRHSKKLYLHKQEHKRWKCRRRKNEVGVTKIERGRIRNGYTCVDMPTRFTFLSNTAEVLESVAKIKKLLQKACKTYINLDNVQEIDNGAITILLSIMTEYKLKKVDFNGSFPKNPDAKKLLFSSGFFEHLFTKVNEKLFSESSKFVYGKMNQIITKPGKLVISSLAAEICESVAITLESKDVIYKGLYRTLIELMHNTNNHADPDASGEELWWLTVHHDQVKKKVSFVFLDWGIGIFKSLKYKKADNPFYGVYDTLRQIYNSDAKILEKILKGEIHRTSTGLKYRGKGLYGIYQANIRKHIKDLHIITNDVYADVQDDKYRIMKNGFNGTFVYWEVDQESEVSTWTK